MTTETYGGYQPPTGAATTEFGTDQGSTQQVKDRAGNVASTAGEQARNVAGEAKTQARNLMSETQDQVRVQASEQKNKAAGGLRDISVQLRSMADGTATGQQTMVTDWARQASNKVQELAGWLETHEPGDLVAEVRTLARRKPGTFLIGAAAAGVIAGRLTRSAVDVKRDDSGSAVGSGTEYAAATTPQGSEWAAPASGPGGTANGAPTQGVAVEDEITVIPTEPVSADPYGTGRPGGDRL